MTMGFPTIHDRKVQNVITAGTGMHKSFDDAFIA